MPDAAHSGTPVWYDKGKIENSSDTSVGGISMIKILKAKQTVRLIGSLQLVLMFAWNIAHADLSACGGAATLIHDVQGEGFASSLDGTTVTIEGIVVGDFQDGSAGVNGDLNGFFVQEEDADADANPLTSEGIFVFDGSSPAVDVNRGDRIRVTGSVSERFSKTQLQNVSNVTICTMGENLPTAAMIYLPIASNADFEIHEGMSVIFPQNLAIVEYFNFDRFGEIVLATDRLFQPTALFAPGTIEAANLASLNALSRITLDDGRTSSNPTPPLHPNGSAFDLDNRFRGGDLVRDVTGVLDYSFGRYRVQPTAGAQVSSFNPRPMAIEPVGGTLRVASLNVLNYFNTLDDGPDICGPVQDQGCRGADDSNERERQLTKIVRALGEMDADIVGLIEVENTLGVEALQDIVTALNDVEGSGSYDFVDADVVGPDTIKVGFIYQPVSVSLVGAVAILDDPGFLDPNALGDPKNRAALTQSFIDNLSGGIFTVALNHFKSKGSSCGTGDDDPEAGNCNLTRTLAAQILVDWLASDPTNSGDSDILILGDLNAYDKEDPIVEILAGPDDTVATDDYTDLAATYGGEFAYSFVFNGQSGYLDYALANADLIDEITGATFWHINADEPDILDYDTTFKRPAEDALFEDNPFRSSDHDPIIVGLDVCDEIAPVIDLELSHETLWPPNHKYVTVSATVLASDNFDDTPALSLLSVTSNEADNGLADGNTVNDIVVVNDTTFRLRAERSGIGSGREYTINYSAEDDCGNSITTSATVSVPLSKKVRK